LVDQTNANPIEVEIVDYRAGGKVGLRKLVRNQQGMEIPGFAKANLSSYLHGSKLCLEGGAFSRQIDAEYDRAINFVAINAGSMTGVAVLDSAIVDLYGTANASFFCEWTATPNGAWTVYGSNIPNASAIGQFTSITFSGTTLSALNPAGVAGNCLINLNQSEWRYVMLRYTNASSTGTLTSTFSAQAL